jgi:hypothetical protein
VTTSTTTVTQTRRVYITPSPSPTKPSRVKSPALSKSSTKHESPSKRGGTSRDRPPSYPSFTSPPLSPTLSASTPVLPPSPPPAIRISTPYVSPPRPSALGFFPRTFHHVPHPEEIILPAPGQYIQGYYVVFWGRECGIFYTWSVRVIFRFDSSVDSREG